MFAVYGPYIAALIAINVLGPGSKQASGLHACTSCEIAAAYDLGHHELRRAVQPVACSFHSNRFGGTLVSQTSEVHERLPASCSKPSPSRFCRLSARSYSRAPFWRRACRYMWSILMALLVGIRYAFRTIMYKRILSLNEKAASAQNQLVGRAVRLGGQHPCREDLGARGLRARVCSIRRTARWWHATRKRMWAAFGPRHHHGMHHRGHHERGGRVHRRRQRVVRHQRRARS